jgi:hypothetical protein
MIKEKEKKGHWQVNSMKSFRKTFCKAEQIMTPKKFKRERFDWRNEVRGELT